MIAGRAQATGIFMDFSPVTAGPPVPALGDVVTPEARAAFSTHRSAPEWGAIFSSDLFAIRPANEQEIGQALCLARQAGSFYLRQLMAGQDGNNAAAITAGQVRYAMAQRQNPHTWRMLSRYVGPHAARQFIDEVLFPLPETSLAA
jgi:hypothetical protein